MYVQSGENPAHCCIYSMFQWGKNYFLNYVWGWVSSSLTPPSFHLDNALLIPVLQVDFDDDDDMVKPLKNMKGLSDDGITKEGINALEDLDGLLEKDKQAVLPLIIDGLEVDSEV